jgi:IPT/TIG domain
VEGGLDHGVLTLDNRSQSSNHSVFVLVPEINAVNPASVASGGLASATLTVTGRRLFEAGTKSVVLVGDTVLPVIDADPIGNPQQDISVHVALSALASSTPPVPPGMYPVRVMVNGVQSLGSVPFQVT